MPLRWLEGAGRALGLRVLSGLVLVAFTVATVVPGGWYFAAWVLLLSLAVLYEWFAMVRCAGRWAAAAAVIGAWLAIAWQGSLVMAAYVTLAGAAGSAVFALPGRRGELAPWAAAGVLYAAIPLVALLWMRGAPASELALLWLFFVVWATDSGAYVAGRLVGGARLAPTISPSKTWSGGAGGLIAGIAIGGACTGLIPADTSSTLAMAALVSLAAQLGDLLQSAIKRRFGRKESGVLIPGHGGAMDRLDSLTAAAPVFAVTVSLLAAMAGAGGG